MSDNLPADTESEQHDPEYADDDDDVVSIESTTLQRDPDTGDLIPRKEYVDELGGDVVARPMTRQEQKRYVEEVASEEKEKEENSDKDLAKLFDRKIVEPDLTQHRLCGENVTEKFVREGLNKTQENGYFIAILLASDAHDMVRRIRGEYNDQEIQMALAAAKQQGNLQPQGDRDENEVRRDRRDR